MKLRSLGSTGLRVTPLGLGLAALGRPGYINLDHARDLNEEYSVPAMEAHTHRVLDAAWEEGIRYFDAARSYGKAEQFLGSWLHARELNPETVAVGSKWGYTYTADWQVDAEVHEVKEHSLTVLRRQWKETQINLGGHLDLYQVHSATLKSGIFDRREVLEELGRLKAEGLIVGMTLSGSNQAEALERALEIEVNGERLFQTVQATWNLLERSVGPALAKAHEAGMGVIVKEALANGRLTSKNTAPEFAEKRALLEYHARRHDTTIDALALAGVLAQPWVSIVLSGAATVAHVESNAKAVEVEWDEELARALDDLTESPEDYWQKRSDLKWN
jgi:aryl-alcohol dehydrogenase-like predicted oxidoreductase